jgi:hypothetical protein
MQLLANQMSEFQKGGHISSAIIIFIFFSYGIYFEFIIFSVSLTQ